MKKLSVEEKAKRYDEAIKRANELNYVSDKDSLQRKTIEHILPELKENEDERIRKEIIEWFKTTVQGSYAGYPMSIILDWFDRQGAKVSAIEGFETEFERQISHLIASAINREHEYSEGYVKWAANALLNYAKHEIEKQGEQKPVDKVKPKFKVGDKIISTISNIPYYITEVCNGHYLTDVGCIIMFNSQDNFELSKQNSAWSEEDEYCMQQLIIFCENCMVQDNGAKRCTHWLKSLKDRYSWNPSDEQMEILQYLCETSSHPNEKVIPTLESLYQDLKKLKE